MSGRSAAREAADGYSRAVVHEVVVEGAGALQPQLAVQVGVGQQQAGAQRGGRLVVGGALPLQPVVLVADELRLLAALVVFCIMSMIQSLHVFAQF